MVEEAGGAGGHPVFEKEVDRVGGERLADRRHVALTPGHVDPDTGHLPHQLRGVRGLGLFDGAASHDAHRGSDLVEPPGRAVGRDEDSDHVEGPLGEGDPQRGHHPFRHFDVGAGGCVAETVDHQGVTADGDVGQDEAALGVGEGGAGEPDQVE